MLSDVTFTPVELSEESKANLLKLADYLETQVKPEYFNMTWFMETKTGRRVPLDERNDHPCCTVCCAVGSGPAAGIPVPEGTIGWADYAYDVFLAHPEPADNEFPRHSLFNWCFGESWSYVDNTPKGAAARIRQMVEQGLPNNHSCQRTGNDPLSYITEE